jgi:hypothetical protein
VALCVVLGAATAHAQGAINLSWGDCGAYGTANRSFACDTNADSSLMVGTFAVDAGGPCFIGASCVIDVQVAGGSLPGWWYLKNPGSCRERSLVTLAPFLHPEVTCADPAAGCGTPGVATYTVGEGGPSRARIVTSYSMPCAVCVPTSAGLEYYAIRLSLRTDRTIGFGSCDGCLMGACIVLNSVGVYASNPDPWDHLELSTPLQRNYITWQGGANNCPGSTPAINCTWGALKSAYR